MRKVYLIERDDHINYDEYTDCVVIAKSKEEAIKIAFDFNYKFMECNIKIKEIKLNSSQMLIANYNRGI